MQEWGPTLLGLPLPLARGWPVSSRMSMRWKGHSEVVTVGDRPWAGPRRSQELPVKDGTRSVSLLTPLQLAGNSCLPG